MPTQNKKSIKCQNCGKVVGTVRLKTKFRRKLIFYALGITLVMQIIAEGLMELVRALFR